MSMCFTAYGASTARSRERDEAEGSSLTKRLIQGATFIADPRTRYAFSQSLDRTNRRRNKSVSSVRPLLFAEIKQRGEKK